MAEIEEECIFEVAPQRLQFLSAKGGDKLVVKQVNFSNEQAAALAWLIKSDVTLEVQIKIKE